MQNSDRPTGRGSELFVGLLVVAFLVFLLWFLLLRPQEPRAPRLEPPRPMVVDHTPVIDDPDDAWSKVITTPKPQTLPTVTPVPRPPPTPTPGVYTVEAGDTLSGIAGRFGLTLEQIVQANRLADPDRLQVGQRLTLPSAKYLNEGL